jgi:hypothetical protein
MKADPILQALEAVKARLAAEAGDDAQRFLEQMEEWLVEHPHAGPVVNSPVELQARLRAREAAELPPPQGKPYRIHDPIIAELHRTRAALARERQAGTLVLKDEPPGRKH